MRLGPDGDSETLYSSRASRKALIAHRQVDGRAIGGGVPGPVTRTLLEGFRRARKGRS
jgi:hypothetical protein